MTLLGWAIVAMVIGARTLGLGRVLVDFAERVVLFGGEILLWIQSLLGG